MLFRLLFIISLMLSSFFNFVLATDLDISNGRLGSIKVGESISSIYKVFNKDMTRKTDLLLEGDPSPAIEVFLSKKEKNERSPALVFEEHPEGKIWRINVLTNKFKTKDGLGIGSRLGDLKKFYKGKIVTGEGNIVFVSSSTAQSFLLNYDELKYLKSKKVPNSVKVKSILILGK